MIRTFEAADLDAVMDLWLTANLDAHDFIPADYWQRHVPAVRKMIPAAEVYVSEQDGIILGFLGLSGDYIAGIFVKKSARRAGVGTELLHTAKKRREKLHLSVYQKNTPAVRFYEREGFYLISQGIDEDTGEEALELSWVP